MAFFCYPKKMEDIYTPQEFKQELKTNPLFFVDFVLDNQPEIVISNMRANGISVNNQEDALNELIVLLNQGNGELLQEILFSVTPDFSKIHEMYHAPLMEALNGQ